MSKGHHRPITIKVKSKLGSSDGVKCEMWETRGKTDLLVFDRKEEGVPDDDWHELKFEVKDDTGGDLRFHPRPDQAIWVVRSETGEDGKVPPCPNRPVQDSKGEFFGESVSEDGRTLTVVNRNDSKGMLSFRLNFVDRDDRKANPDIVASHDPGVQNKNGSSSGG